MPVQDFGNAFSTFIAQNYGAGEEKRIRSGLRGAILAAMLFCLVITAGIWLLARPLMLLFVDANETAIIAEGVRYLHIEAVSIVESAVCSCSTALYRAVGRPGMSVALTVISLGTRWRWPTCCPRSPPSGWLVSGGRCRSAGSSPI